MTLLLGATYTGAFSQVPTANHYAKPIQFECLGKIKNQPLFQLSLNNEEREEYVVTIKDGGDDVIFSEHLLGTAISRNYALEIMDSDLTDPEFRLKFEITDSKHHLAAVFNVTKSVKMVENILVAKL